VTGENESRLLSRTFKRSGHFDVSRAAPFAEGVIEKSLVACISPMPPFSLPFFSFFTAGFWRQHTPLERTADENGVVLCTAKKEELELTHVGLLPLGHKPGKLNGRGERTQEYGRKGRANSCQE